MVNKGPGPILFNDYWWKKFERAEIGSDFFVTIVAVWGGHLNQTMPGEIDKRKPRPLATRKQTMEWSDEAVERGFKPHYRIRVIKRDPATYLDRLIAAAEANAERAWEKYTRTQAEADGQAWKNTLQWLETVNRRQEMERSRPKLTTAAMARTKTSIQAAVTGDLSAALNAR